MFSEPQSGAKRPFTDMDNEEKIAVKRARKYLGSEEDDDEVMQSPFFSTKRGATIVEGVMSPEPIEEIDTDMDDEEIQGNIEEAEVEVGDEMMETEERQVSESPPRITSTDTTEMKGDEVIPDSPIGPVRTQAFQTEITDEDNTVLASPECHSNNHNIFPPSPLHPVKIPQQYSPVQVTTLQFSVLVSKKPTPHVHLIHISPKHQLPLRITVSLFKVGKIDLHQISPIQFQVVL